MSRDKEFRRPKDAVRQPAGKTETDVRTGEMRGQDFDLRRARDAPVQEDNRHRGWNLYQGASEDGAVPATDSNTYAAASRQPVDEMAAYESADYGTHAEAFSRQSSGDSDSFIQDSRSVPQQNGPDFSGRDSFRESRQQDSRHSDSGRLQRRDADFSRRGGQELPGSGSSEASAASEAGSTNAGETSGRRRMHQHGNKYQQRFQEAAKAEEPQEKQPGSAEGEPKRPSKLEFTADELPPEAADKKLTQARRRAERVEKKLEDAEARLPSRKKLRMETASDPETGKAKKRLKFEQEVKSQRAHVKGSLPMRPVKAAANTAVGYAHKKIYQAEEENVGVKAAHRTELVGAHPVPPP